MMAQIKFKTSFARLASVVFVIATLCVSINVAGQSQAEKNPDDCDFTKADAKLNKVYQQVLVEYRQDKIFIEKLKIAQRAWLVFRDAHLDSIYPASGQRTYGSVSPMCRCLIIVQLTEERTKTLQQWIDGTIEGDVCAGSVRIKR